MQEFEWINLCHMTYWNIVSHSKYKGYGLHLQSLSYKVCSPDALSHSQNLGHLCYLCLFLGSPPLYINDLVFGDLVTVIKKKNAI